MTPRRARRSLFAREPRALVAAAGSALLVVAAFLAPAARTWWGGAASGAQPPSLRHPLGTALGGGDVVVLVLEGLRTSLTIAIAALTVSLVVGTAWGAFAAVAGRRVDGAMMRFVEFLAALPGLLLLVLVMAIAHAGAGGPFDDAVDPAAVLALALGGLRALAVARVARGLFYGLRRRGFVRVARAQGASALAVVRAHVLPHAGAPLLMYAALGAPVVVVEEAFLSFLGLGVGAPRVSLGALVLEGLRTAAVHPWILLSSSFALVALVASLRLFAEGLRDALDAAEGKT